MKLNRPARTIAVSLFVLVAALFAFCGPHTRRARDYDPAFTVTARYQGHPVIHNLSPATFKLDVIGRDEANQSTIKVFPSMAAAFEATPYDYHSPLLPSIDCADSLSKSIDDGLIAGLEAFMHDRDGIYPGGKQGLLMGILADLLAQPVADARDEAAARIAAAVELGGDEPLGLTPGMESEKDELIEAFLCIQIESKPIGIYTQSRLLTRVFQRDRFLQKPARLEAGSIDWAIPIARVLDADPAKLKAYETYLRLSERITNPTANFHMLDLLDHRARFADPAGLAGELTNSSRLAEVVRYGNIRADKIGVAFWPFSTSREVRLFARIIRATGDLPGSRMELFTNAVAEGEVDLTPEAESGYYDYQVYALETLLLPEKAPEFCKLVLSDNYRKRLRNAFQSLLTQRRETHAKQLMWATTEGNGDSPITVQPVFRVEPAPEVYLRQARAYRALGGFIHDLAGNAPRSVRFPDDRDFYGRVDYAAAVFYGLYLVSLNDLGLAPALEPGELEGLDCLASAERTVPGWMYEDLAHYSYQSFIPADADVTTIETSLRNHYPVAGGTGLDAAEADRYINALLLAEDWLVTEGFPDYDARVIVPISQELEDGSVTCWAVIGVVLDTLTVEFDKLPGIYRTYHAADLATAGVKADEAMRRGRRPSKTEYDSAIYLIPEYVFVEVTLPKPLDREEFREICDRAATIGGITAQLESYPPATTGTILDRSGAAPGAD